jgi:hypothetical protein
VGQQALLVAREEMMTPAADRRAPVITQVGKVLSSAAMRLSVLELERRAS